MRIKLLALFLVPVLMNLCGCSGAKPIMEGCKRLPLQDRDWSECNGKVA